METKWVAIGIIGLMTALMSPIAIQEYSKTECKLTAIKQNMSADDILKLCLR